MSSPAIAEAGRTQATFWRRVTQPKGQCFGTTWAALFGRMGTPCVAKNKRELAGWAPVVFDGDMRALATVQRCYAIGLDIDGGTSFQDARDFWSGSSGFIHTTFSHEASAPRLRVILILSRPVGGAEYRPVWEWAKARAQAAGQTVDPSAKDPSRLWFVPGVRDGGEFLSTALNGTRLDVDRALSAIAGGLAAPRLLPRLAPAPDLAERARRYLERCPPAVAGQHGHSRTFVVAQRLVRGFSLDEATALALLADWNKRCSPPWSVAELARKVAEAARAGTMQPGSLKSAGGSR